MNKSISKYLSSGPQTNIGTEIKNLSKSFRKDGINLIFEILDWFHKNLKEKNGRIKNKFFRRRTAQEIIKSGFVTGCTDWALAFIVLARTKKIPTVYVETIRRKWLETGKDDFIEGHVFAEVYIDDHWYIVDPEQSSIKDKYGKWVVFKRGLDSWDIGIKSFEGLKEQFLSFREEFRKNKNS